MQKKNFQLISPSFTCFSAYVISSTSFEIFSLKPSGHLLVYCFIALSLKFYSVINVNRLGGYLTMFTIVGGCLFEPSGPMHTYLLILSGFVLH